MSRPLWVVTLIKKGFPLKHFLARLTRVPVIGEIMDHLLFEGDDMIYLPIDHVVQIDTSVEPEGSMVLPSQVVDYFIETANFHWIMNYCICRDSAGCKDYPIELGCLFMGEAAMNINPELGRRVTKEEALEHVRKCREAGLVHLIGRNKLDAVWLNVGPGTKLLTVCNCCPCCCLWRMLPDLALGISEKVAKMPGVSVTVNNNCVGCRMCTDVCFVNAITIVEECAVISDECRGCGRCVTVCPQNAIEISIDKNFVERSIDHISELVDVS
jgi:ferredoxin